MNQALPTEGKPHFQKMKTTEQILAIRCCDKPFDLVSHLLSEAFSWSSVDEWDSVYIVKKMGAMFEPNC